MTTFDKIPELLRQNDIKYWTIRTKKDSNSYVFKYDDSRSFDDNINRMQDIMRLYQGGYFVLDGKENAASNKGMYCFEFSNESTTPSLGSMPQYQQPVVGSGMSEIDIETRIKNATDAVRLEFRQADLERREKDLATREKEYRQEKASTIGILVDRIGKVIPKIFPQIAVAGMPGEQVQISTSVAKSQFNDKEATEIDTIKNDEQDAATAELESLLERFAAVEPEWLPLLRRMVEMAEAKDATYNMARNFLLSK